MVSWHIIGMVVVSLKRKTNVLLVRRVLLLQYKRLPIMVIMEMKMQHSQGGLISHIMLRMQWIEYLGGGQQEMAVYG